MRQPVHRHYDPDILGAENYIPQNPICHRCGREATRNNPIGISFRPTWNPFERYSYRHMDALCAKCREWMSIR